MSSKLQADGCYYKPVVAPSGECLRGKGRCGVFAALNCVIHAWALQRWTSHNGALYNSIFFFTSAYDTLSCCRAYDTTLAWPWQLAVLTWRAHATSSTAAAESLFDNIIKCLGSLLVLTSFHSATVDVPRFNQSRLYTWRIRIFSDRQQGILQGSCHSDDCVRLCGALSRRG